MKRLSFVDGQALNLMDDLLAMTTRARQTRVVAVIVKLNSDECALSEDGGLERAQT